MDSASLLTGLEAVSFTVGWGDMRRYNGLLKSVLLGLCFEAIMYFPSHHHIRSHNKPYSKRANEASRLQEVDRPAQVVWLGLEASTWNQWGEREERALGSSIVPGSERAVMVGLSGYPHKCRSLSRNLSMAQCSRPNGLPCAKVPRYLLSFRVAEDLKLYLEFALHQTLNNSAFLKMLTELSLAISQCV